MSGQRKIIADVLRYDPHLGYWEAWRHGRPVAHAHDLDHLRSHCQDGVLLIHTPLVTVNRDGYTWRCSCGETMPPGPELHTRDEAYASSVQHYASHHNGPKETPDV